MQHNHVPRRPPVLCKSWGRWDCAASMHRSASAVRADTELIRGAPATENWKDPHQSFLVLML